ncbi:MAG: non-hydrolyzing UDP-N-acetylglucosamine 2-epimerase [bacterium]
MKLIHIVGARPQFIKLAPLCTLLKDFHSLIVHTGQHYDYLMDKVFFDQLGIPTPHYNLEVGSATHGKQTGLMLSHLEEVLLKEKPELVILYGDTNSTLAGAIAASKLSIPIVHVEAGLRSYNKKMPEEINRVVTDQVASILLCPTEQAARNLQKEGFNSIYYHGKLAKKFLIASMPMTLPFVINVGDIMYDSLLASLKLAKEQSHILQELELLSSDQAACPYAVCTIHRQENTDNINNLKNILYGLTRIAETGIKIIFPVHPRTEKVMKTVDIDLSSLMLIDPVPYLDMLMLESKAQIIITDSGGMQKEAFFLNVPCLTIREQTEWGETIALNMNTLAKPDPDTIVRVYKKMSQKPSYATSKPYGEGNSAELMVTVIKKYRDQYLTIS